MLRCEVSGDEFEISANEIEYCARNLIPLRSCSATERLRQILSFRSSPHLYHATCVISGERVVTVIPPNSGYQIYDAALEGELEAEQYARPYDFKRNFFEQYEELARTVPYFSRAGIPKSNENCDYSQGAVRCKNCYLCFRAVKSEDCLYSRYIRSSKDLVDCIWCLECELAYACSDITRCYDLAFCEHCVDCSCCKLLSDCVGCRDCICCVGLRGAQYCFENKQLSPDEYRTIVRQINLGSRLECDYWNDRLQTMKGDDSRTQFLDRCEDSTGNYLVGCSGVKQSYLIYDCVDIESCIGVQKLHSSFFSVGHGSNSELLYSCEIVGDQAYDVRFSVSCQNSVQNLEYCINVSGGSAHCFGCIGLRRASYSILNQRYSKEEYFSLVERIRNQMRLSGDYGKFIPLHLSPFAFNRSEAFDFFPLAKSEALQRSLRWDEDELTDDVATQVMPDQVFDVTDDAARGAFQCVVSGRSYRLQAYELAYHRRLGIGFSAYAPLERMARRGRFLQLY